MHSGLGSRIVLGFSSASRRLVFVRLHSISPGYLAYLSFLSLLTSWNNNLSLAVVEPFLFVALAYNSTRFPSSGTSTSGHLCKSLTQQCAGHAKTD